MPSIPIPRVITNQPHRVHAGRLIIQRVLNATAMNTADAVETPLFRAVPLVMPMVPGGVVPTPIAVVLFVMPTPPVRATITRITTLPTVPGRIARRDRLRGTQRKKYFTKENAGTETGTTVPSIVTKICRVKFPATYHVNIRPGQEPRAAH